MLRRYDEPQKSCYRSKAVVRFCRKRWRSAKVFKRTFSDGILFSSDFAALAEAKGLPPGLKELPLGLEGPTLELCRDYSVRLSQDAYDLIGPRASAYISRQYIALRPDRRGELRFHYHLGGADTFSLQLSRLIPTFYPMAEQLHLEAHRDLFVLTAENAGGPYPPRDYFFRVSLEDQANDYS